MFFFFYSIYFAPSLILGSSTAYSILAIILPKKTKILLIRAIPSKRGISPLSPASTAVCPSPGYEKTCSARILPPNISLIEANCNVIAGIRAFLKTWRFIILKRLSPLALAKDIYLELIADKEVVAEVDVTKFTLAISNLIENGIKYTDNGGTVTVYVDCDHQNAFITVSDTGIGMAEKELTKIFQRFYRIDKTRDRQTGGTGLGLSITHSTVLMHDGSIKVTSRENEGTTFVVRIPLIHNSINK